MAIPQPEPRDWQVTNAKELKVTDRQVLAMLRAAYKDVNAILADLPAGKAPIRRAQLEETRSRLLAQQAAIFTKLGDIVSARRLAAASRSAGLSAASNLALLEKVGLGAEGEYLYKSALETSQRAIDVAMQRMRLSALPLSQRIYNTTVWMNGRLGKLINQTLAVGLNAREFAAKARDWFNPNTPGGVRYAAMRLARTEINNAFHSISAEKYANTPWIPKVAWNLSKSHPKPDICNEVAADSPYDSGEVPSRPHPQCMCYITPESIDEDEFVENFLDGQYDDYLDSELAKAGWAEPEQKSAPTKAPKTPTVESRPPALTPEPLTGRAANAAVPKGLFKRGTLTPKQRKAVKTYESGWFAVINGFLRSGSKVNDSVDQQSAGTVADIDSAMDGSVLEVPIQTWRGMFNATSLFGDRLNNDLTGFAWNELGYGSTSSDIYVTRLFMAEVGARMLGTKVQDRFKGKDVQIKVTIRAGTKALELSNDEDGSDTNGPQDEITIQRNTVWRVTKDNGRDANGTRQLEVEVYPIDAESDAGSAGSGATGGNLQGSSPQRANEPDSSGPRAVVRSADGYLPGDWKGTQVNEEILDLAKKFEAASNPEKTAKQIEENGPDWALKLAGEIMAGLTEDTDVSYKNGPHRVKITGAMSEEDQRTFLEYVDRMQTKFPTGRHMSISVAPPSQFGRGVGGETTIGTGSMFINANVMQMDKWPGMPVSKTVRSALYVLAHEWGHALSTKDEANDGHIHHEAIEAGGMTRYGTHGTDGVLAPGEGYAEAFAEWALSEGKTTNPAALKYAEKFKWGERFGI